MNQEFPELTNPIHDVVHPKLYPADAIRNIVVIEVNSGQVHNPFKGNGEKEWIDGRTLFTRLLEEGWKLSMMGWIREDGGVNYGHEPTVNLKLRAVFVQVDEK